MQLVGLRIIIVTGLYYVERERTSYAARLRCVMDGMTRKDEGEMAGSHGKKRRDEN